MKLKPLVVSLFLVGLAGSSAMAAEQRGDILRLRQNYTDQATSNHGNWLLDHTKVGVEINADVSLSDTTRANVISARLGPYGSFARVGGLTGNLLTDAGQKNNSSDITLGNSNGAVDIFPDTWVMGHLEFSSNQNTVRASLDEAYVVLGHLADSPFFLSAGREYAAFGSYGEPHPLTASLTQELSQIQATLVNVGYAQACGAYIEGSFFRGTEQQPVVGLAGVTNYHETINNGVIDAGYDWGDGQGLTGVNLNAGWLMNMADVTSINGAMTAMGNGAGNGVAGRYTDRVGGLALSAAGYYNQVDAKLAYVGALKAFNAFDGVNNGAVGAKPRAWSAELGYGFTSMGHEQRVALGYQKSNESLAMGIPKSRVQADYTYNLFKNTNVQLQYTHDEDYGTAESANTGAGVPVMGTGRADNTGKVRLSVDLDLL